MKFPISQLLKWRCLCCDIVHRCPMACCLAPVMTKYPYHCKKKRQTGRGPLWLRGTLCAPFPYNSQLWVNPIRMETCKHYPVYKNYKHYSKNRNQAPRYSLSSSTALECWQISISLGWIPRRVVSAYDVVNASYLPTTINIYDLEIRSINNYRKSYDIASFLVSTKISRRCRFGNSKPCKYIPSSYVRRNCIYDNNRVSANISSYDYRWFLS